MRRRGDRPPSRSALVVVAAALAAAPARAGEQKFRPGRYAVVTETTVERDGQSHALAPTKDEYCYGENDLESYRKMTRGLASRERGCETTEPKRSGDRLSWTMRCPSGATGMWELTQGRDRFEFRVETSAPGGSHGSMKMRTHTTATRTGDCSK